MSDVIEAYIRRSSGMSEEAAFQGFLAEERIRAWVGDDPSRKERLRREFARAWASLHPPSTPSRQGPALVRQAPPQPLVVTPRPEAPAPAPTRPAGPARQLQVLCPTCGQLDVWLQDGAISCHTCESSYDDMLLLIPVKPVGLLEFYFGTGWKGAATMAGVLGGLAILYYLLRELG